MRKLQTVTSKELADHIIELLHKQHCYIGGKHGEYEVPVDGTVDFIQLAERILERLQ